MAEANTTVAGLGRMINVTAVYANSCRASQGQIAAEMARAIDRASRNR